VERASDVTDRASTIPASGAERRQGIAVSANPQVTAHHGWLVVYID